MKRAWELYNERGIIVPGHEEEIAEKLNQNRDIDGTLPISFPNVLNNVRVHGQLVDATL